MTLVTTPANPPQLSEKTPPLTRAPRRGSPTRPSPPSTSPTRGLRTAKPWLVALVLDRFMDRRRIEVSEDGREGELPWPDFADLPGGKVPERVYRSPIPEVRPKCWVH